MKTAYTFVDGALTNTISSMIAKGNGLYEISYTSSWTNDFAVTSAAPILYTRTTAAKVANPTIDPVTGKETAESKKNRSNAFENKYMVGAKRLRMLGQINLNADGTYAGTNLNDGTTYFDEYLSTLSSKQLENLIKEEENYINLLNDKYGESTKGWLVRYAKNTTTGEWNPYFVNADMLESDNMIYDDETGASQTAIDTYKLGTVKENEEFKCVKARMESDTSGRIISVTLRPGEVDEVTYSVTTSTVTDQAKYDDAMNQYEYDKAQYDQAIREVNAKIEIIQSQDKNLELRLKQLDTEQEAIQTEMDAVQKVIEKNTESTFKTFG